MKKINKKKIILLIIIVLVIMALITTAIIFATNKEESEDGILASSEFENMKVKDVTVTYDEEKDTTYFNYIVENISSSNVENETVNVMAIDENDAEIAGVQVTIRYIEAQGEYKMSFSLLGNLSYAKKLALKRPEIAE